MPKTSQPMPSDESSDDWFDKIIEASRQALLENKRKYPPLDLEHYEATGEFRPLAPPTEPNSLKEG